MRRTHYSLRIHHVREDICVCTDAVTRTLLYYACTATAAAQAFDNGMQYFATFGGSTAACAAGLAVLDVIYTENLQVHTQCYIHTIAAA
jgi:4-aminobutyrate aminotransferase-like enzyme